ncbi:SRPBCC domain-containing protein [Mesorhizobium sp. BR1-1-16]|uniref:SRPBCC family protein n=1 Tax=Mesorhizobium sp. BR1-1-16 TaxID=2876653 RepID=UPI001CCE1C53|nr:SRPBCC domain-containing protein [Mesorhizobium sp. BR1-1-16]MBZ9937302.1 SRPBCC domain-containing protein [Mesorhizobium sp. BR1-1-16]
MTETASDIAHDDAAAASDATKTVALVMETDLDAAIDTVWRAITDPALVARWLLPGGMAAEAGAAFNLDGGAALGTIDCTVIESDPPRRLAYRWQKAATETEPALDTVVRFDLAARPEGGTRLKLAHEGFVVAADRPVDAVAPAEEEMIVLLPMAALMRRRIARRRRPAAFSHGAMPTLMRLAA